MRLFFPKTGLLLSPYPRGVRQKSLPGKSTLALSRLGALLSLPVGNPVSAIVLFPVEPLGGIHFPNHGAQALLLHGIVTLPKQTVPDPPLHLVRLLRRHVGHIPPRGIFRAAVAYFIEI